MKTEKFGLALFACRYKGYVSYGETRTLAKQKLIKFLCEVRHV